MTMHVHRCKGKLAIVQIQIFSLMCTLKLNHFLGSEYFTASSCDTQLPGIAGSCGETVYCMPFKVLNSDYCLLA